MVYQRIEQLKPRVIIRADAGSKIGFGHFVRSVALASYLSDDFEVMFATRNPDIGRPSEYQLQQILEAGAQVCGPQIKDRDQYDAEFLRLIDSNDIVVLDNYYYSTEYQNLIRKRAHKLICIDDVHDRHFTADAVITFCPLRREDFSLEPYTRFFGGIEWSFLRKPFLSSKTKKREGDIKRIVMAMGGADPYRLTDKMIRIIRKIDSELNIDVIAGQTVQVNFSEDSNLKIWRMVDADKIVELFDNADAGIFPASTVCIEAFSRKLPIIAGHYIDNQKEFYEYGIESEWFAPLGFLLDSEEEIENRLKKIVSEESIPTPPDFNFSKQKSEIIKIFRNISTL